MGVFKSEITLRNPVQPTLKPVKVTALVDTGALHLCLPEHIALQLELKELEKREVTLEKNEETATLALPQPGSEGKEAVPPQPPLRT